MLFGSSGIRRRFDQTLVNLALRVGAGMAQDRQTVLVGMDTRTTSRLLADSVIAGLISAGTTVDVCGVAPTPTIAYGARTRGAGCMITASHNPEAYNGLKLFNPDGSSFTLAQQQEIEELLEGEDQWAAWNEQGHLRQVDAITVHTEAILDQITPKKEITAIVDCGNGAGCTVTPNLLKQAGVKTICLNCNPRGRFARPSEPLRESFPYLPELIRKRGATCAVMHDGDADRMMAFDDKGRYIGGDHMLMLLTKYLGAAHVVTTSDASMAIEEIAEVRRTPVGDSFVSEELLRWGEFGGEPSGAWIFPDISLCPDGPYAAALLCEIASEWTISEVIDEMPDYPILRESVQVEDARGILTALGAENPTDGLRIEEENGWCLIRASGTEPKVRLTAEGKALAGAKAMLARGHDLLKKGRGEE